MDNQDVAKLKARGRVELLILFFVLVLAVGGVAEYRHLTAPMSSAMVVFDYTNGQDAETVLQAQNQKKPLSSQTQNNTIIAPTEAKAPASKLNPPKAQEISAPSALKNETATQDEVKNLSERAQSQSSEQNAQLLQANNQTEEKGRVTEEKLPQRDGAAELTDYMQEIHQKAENISRPQSALGQIQERPVVKKVQRQPQPVFEAGKIEIYDSEKGVVAVQETVEVIAPQKDVQTETKSKEKTTEVADIPVVEKSSEPQTSETVHEQIKADSQGGKSSETSDKSQPTLLVPLRADSSSNEPATPQAVEEVKAAETSVTPEAPVDMLKNIQENKAEIQDKDIKAAEVKENTPQMNENKADLSVSDKKANLVADEVVEKKQAEVKVDSVEDKAAKSKKANEALENLFKKMSEPNALDSSVIPQNDGKTLQENLDKNSGESVENNATSNQMIENNTKNDNQSATSSDENGAVDMMKAIVSRK